MWIEQGPRESCCDLEVAWIRVETEREDVLEMSGMMSGPEGVASVPGFRSQPE